MKTKLALTLFVLFALLLPGSSSGAARADTPAAALGTAITYQGRLNDGGVAANGSYDFRFTLYNALSGGAQVGSLVTLGDVPVSDGYFTVQLDFGAGAFGSEARWLEVAVRPGTSSGAYTVLSPRQALTPAPFALYAATAGSLPWSGLTGVPAGLANGAWSLTGNAGTNPSTNYLGTSDNQAFEIRVNGQRALRLEPNASAPNVIAGYGGNLVTSGVTDATISGGGTSGSVNKVTDTDGTIGGGVFNTAGNNNGDFADASDATVSGGAGNIASGYNSTVSGGSSNTAGGYISTVSGGTSNSAAGWMSTVGGGWFNDANSDGASVGGGTYNLAQADYATISGGGPLDPDSPFPTDNRVFDNYGTIGGGTYNRVGSDDANTTTAQFATIGGGRINTASAQSATVGGGWVNTASGNAATVPGGANNEASGAYSFAAGADAHATQDGAFVWSSSERTDSFGVQTFTVRAPGGARFYTASGTATGVQLAAGGGSFASLSDRNAKFNFAPVNDLQVLQKVAALPLSTWSYRSQDASILHMGPMAQDFSAAFGLGEDAHYIGTLDADGVALASIQGLYRLNQQQAAEIQSLKAQLSQMEKAGSPHTTGSTPLIWVVIGLLGLSQAGMFLALRRRIGGRS